MIEDFTSLMHTGTCNHEIYEQIINHVWLTTEEQQELIKLRDVA